ncbi:hypothetical protein T03_5895 [Trichinella britovi]|uniref:Uncharacterized protein n=1 Tax=Trichinella britovi TaxID=45882 RepID=A0A0V1AKR1_TRIBR|nr:hypothetical protein T03_5895 [Trichinella britovi]
MPLGKCNFYAIDYLMRYLAKLLDKNGVIYKGK